MLLSWYTVLTGGTAAIILGTAGARAETLVVYTASNYLHSGFGAIDKNRRVCFVPDSGFQLPDYVFALDEPVVETDPENR